MYLLENPVLQRELITNLRATRAFGLMLVYQVALAAVVLFTYPSGQRIDISTDSTIALKLVDFFFVGQYVLASLMAPTFASGAISGEKERKTYEMLLASPLRPWAIVLGKMIASLTHLAVLIFCSLPIIMLALPLGGVSIYEVFAAYLWLLSSILLFGSIALYCSSIFKRTASSLLVSYLIILPMVILGTILWRGLAEYGNLRLQIMSIYLPIAYLAISWLLCRITAKRLLYPADVGSQGNEVVDLEAEDRNAVGMVIQRDQFPDRLFAPPRRQALMRDTANPVYDKEIHAELFSQGTLMLRLVIQISMLIAIPLMGFLLFVYSQYCAWYICYVLVFNILVAPVFSSGAISSERERQTLELLLTTPLKPAQILVGKMIAGFRVSYVLTMFLMWPVILATILAFDRFGSNWLAILSYFAIVLVAAIFNSCLALLCSVLCKKTSVAMLTSYSLLLLAYFLPVAIYYLGYQLGNMNASDLAEIRKLGVFSPLFTSFTIPLDSNISFAWEETNFSNQWWPFWTYLTITTTTIVGMYLLARTALSYRWGITGR